MEIKLKNKAMCVDMLKKYIEGIEAGYIPYPRCCLCHKKEGEILGLYLRPGESTCTVFAICVECWIANRSEDGEAMMKEYGQLDAELMKKVGEAIENLLTINLPNEILRVEPEINEWMN